MGSHRGAHAVGAGDDVILQLTDPGQPRQVAVGRPLRTAGADAEARAVLVLALHAEDDVHEQPLRYRPGVDQLGQREP